MYGVLLGRLQEKRRFLQVLAGPRQTGKTTLVHQVRETLALPSHYASADSPTVESRAWIEQQWELGRLLLRDAPAGGAVLFLDEVQKVSGWSPTVKALWDQDTAARRALQVVLLGSSPLLVQQGLSESLAGRFELLRAPHWSYAEMAQAFGWTLDEYVYYGGYPGGAGLIADPPRWRNYIQDALVETSVARDVLLMTRVDKPALLRTLFALACAYSGQVLSYQKMLGQLQDAGNTTTLAHYLHLLAGAGLVLGLPKFTGAAVRTRASSPKLQVLNTALLATARGVPPFEAARQTPDLWGRFVESAVGAHLVNGTAGAGAEISYWLERGREVDFVLQADGEILAIEVKSGAPPRALPGLEAFRATFPAARFLLVGGDGMPLETFLRTPPLDLLGAARSGAGNQRKRAARRGSESA
ncbi:MAG: ATP-binding protein [Candidatus Methylomirabilales bacterium]